MVRNRCLVPAAVAWRAGNLYNSDYGDNYHSVSGAAAESQHVFIEGNHLAERMARCQRSFVVAELGFGTGLNLCLCWQAWRDHAPAAAQLHYLAWELQPLEREQLQQFLVTQVDPEIAAAVADKLPLRWPGWHRFALAPNVFVTLAYEDVAWLKDARFAADAWLLDGFAPDRNPAMWSAEVVAQVYRLTAPGGSVSTFSAASAVRHALSAAGFEVRSAAGFAPKREMTCAQRPGPVVAVPAPPATIGIVGAGVASVSLQYALQARGLAATQLAPVQESLTAASTNPAVLLTPRPTIKQTSLGDVVTAAFAYAHQLLEQWQLGTCSGTLLLAYNERERSRQQGLAALQWPADLCRVVDVHQAQKLAGIPVDTGGMWLPLARQLDGRKLMARLSADVSCTQIDTQVTAVRPAAAGGWQADTRTGSLHFDAMVLACGLAVAELAPDGLAVREHPGSWLALPANAASAALRLPLLFGGCLNPAQGGQHLLTADVPLPPALAQLFVAIEAQPVWQATRCKMNDHLALAGSLGEGLAVLGGLGSRGFVQALLLAELVVAELLHEPPPFPGRLIDAVAPGPTRRQWG